MAVIERSFGVILINNAAGTPVDISDQVSRATLRSNRNAGQYYTLGSQWANASDGKASWEVELEIIMTDATGETEAYGLVTTWHFVAGQPGARTITLQTPDDQAGSFEFEGEVKLASVDRVADVDASSNEPQRFTVRLMGDGALTKSTIV